MVGRAQFQHGWLLGPGGPEVGFVPLVGMANSSGSWLWGLGAGSGGGSLVGEEGPSMADHVAQGS